MAGGSGSGDSSSVIKGGGKDMTRIDGQQKKGEDLTPAKNFNLKAAEAELERQEINRLKAEGAYRESHRYHSRLAAIQKSITDRHYDRRFAHPDRG